MTPVGPDVVRSCAATRTGVVGDIALPVPSVLPMSSARPLSSFWPAVMVLDSQKRYFIVLVCYLDDSGEEKEPIIACAGYLSFADEWQKFEAEAREFFNLEGVEYLHTLDLYHRHNQFKGWDTSRTLKFAHNFFSILSKHVGSGFEFSVLKSRFREMKAAHGVKREGSAFAFCFKGIFDQIVKDDGFLSVINEPWIDLSFVVETGNKNNQNVMDTFNYYKSIDPNRFRSLSFDDKKKRIALQAADFLAYYSRRIRNKSYASEDTVPDMRFFKTATEAVSHPHFLATDFGA
jgi:Protein of unknown function (DUF3800)